MGFSAANYERKIEELVGSYVAEFQQELSLARKMQDSLDGQHTLLAYPKAVYHPKAILKMPLVKQFIARTGGKLSNCVPRVLSAELVDGYPLGAYYRKH
jgi:hypothetical protein